jgi:hypothetical protein
METFLMWMFGPRQIEAMVRLAHAARERAEFLQEVPDGAQVRQELIRIARELAERAERKLLNPEADLAGSLLAAARLDDRTPTGTMRQARVALLLEEMLARRLAAVQHLARLDATQRLAV